MMLEVASKQVGTERIDGSAIDFYGSSFVADATGRKPAEGGHSEDEVNFHTWRLIKGIALATLLSVGAELTFGGTGNDLISAIRESAHDTSNQVGQATPITYDMRCRIIAAAGDKLIGLCDKALLSVAYDTVRP